MKKSLLVAGALLLSTLALGCAGFGQEPDPQPQGPGEAGPPPQGPRGWERGRSSGPEGGWEPEIFGGRGGEARLAARLMAALDNERVKAYLNLTEPQADRLRQILVDAEKSTVKTRADIAVRGIELRELLRADKPDRDAVIKKVQEISDLRGQMMKSHVESLLAAKSVLTPEQQKKIRSFIESRAAFGGGRPGFGARREWLGAPRREAGPRPPAPPARPGEPPVE